MKIFKKLKLQVNLMTVFAIMIISLGVIMILIYYPAIEGYIKSRAAGTYYVNCTTGSDGNNGSQGSPWKTIAYAASQGNTVGDIIYVDTGSNGVCSETSQIRLSTGVSLIGEENGTNPSGTIIQGDGSVMRTIEVSNGSKLIGFTVINPANSDCCNGAVFGIDNGADWVEIYNNIFIGKDTKMGVNFQSSTKAKIYNNVFDFFEGGNNAILMESSAFIKSWNNLFLGNNNGTIGIQSDAASTSNNDNFSGTSISVPNQNNLTITNTKAVAVDLAGRPGVNTGNYDIASYRLLNTANNSSLLNGGVDENGAANNKDLGAYPDSEAVSPNLYVDDGGNNTNGGISTGDAWKTITYALQQVNNRNVTGYIINVGVGTYNAGLGETFGLNIPAGITLQGPGITDLNNLAVIDGGGSNNLITSLGSNAKIDGLKITGLKTTNPGFGISSNNNSQNIIVSNNIIEGSDPSSESIGFIAQDNNGAVSGTVSANIFYNLGDGVQIVGQGGNGAAFTLANNIFYNNNYGLKALGNNAVLTIRNNIFLDGSNGISLQNGASASYSDYNLFYSNSGNDYEGLTAGAHDQTVNPRLVDAANHDFRVFDSSPVIAAASDSGNIGWYQGEGVAGGPWQAVKYVANNGHDVNCNGNSSASYPGSGTNQNCAYRTITQSLIYASETIWLGSGTYSLDGGETFPLMVAVNLEGEAGINPSTVIIDGTGVGNDVNGIVVNNNAIDVKKLTVKNFTGNGVLIQSGKSNITLQNNLIYNNSGQGISATGGTGITVVNNTIYNNGSSGLVFNNTTGTVKNNIIVNNGSIGINAENNASLTISYNNVYNNSSGNYGGSAIAGTGDISQNPYFINSESGNFTLYPHSHCIDAGDSSMTDPDSTRINMGVFGATAFAEVKSYADEIYVNAVLGDDLHDGSQATLGNGNVGPKATITACLLSLNTGGENGGICHVAAGTYNENINLVTLATVSGAGPNTTIIQGDGNADVVTFNGVSQANISGFTIQNGRHGIYLNSADNNEIYNNIIVNNGATPDYYAGIYLENSDRNEFYNNSIRQNGYGARLTTTCIGNNFTHQRNSNYQNSEIKDNIVYNIYDDVDETVTTNFSDVDFDYIDHSDKIMNSGGNTWNVYYRARAYANNMTQTELSNISIIFKYINHNTEQEEVAPTLSDVRTGTDGAESDGYTEYNLIHAYNLTNQGLIVQYRDLRVYANDLIDEYADTEIPEELSLVRPSFSDDNYNTISFTLEEAGRSQAYYPRETNMPVPVVPLTTPSLPIITTPNTPVVAAPIKETEMDTIETDQEEAINAPINESKSVGEIKEGESSEAAIEEQKTISQGIKKVTPPTPVELKEKTTLKLIRTENSSMVYVVDLEAGTRQVIVNEKVFAERGYSWSDVITESELLSTPQAVSLDRLSLINPVLHKVGTAIKFSDTKVYEVISEGVIKHIPNEAVFEEKYGEDGWNKIKEENDSLMALYGVVE